MKKLIYIVLGLTLGALMGPSSALPQASHPLKDILEQDTLPQLQVIYDRMSSEYFLAVTKGERDTIRVDQELVSNIMQVKAIAELKANDVFWEDLSTQVSQSAEYLDKLVHQKWCHQTLWRRMRGYREPAWCNK
jgi:hypothetical protein